jgi:hypothetical protein
MFDFEILGTNCSPIKLVSSPDEGFADLNVMDLVPDSEYISPSVSPLKGMPVRKQLNIGMCTCVCVCVMDRWNVLLKISLYTIIPL